MLAALLATGTAHIYADTADCEELSDLLEEKDNVVYREVDGNTVNQPLVHKIIDRYLAQAESDQWLRHLTIKSNEHLSEQESKIVTYMVICGRIASDILRGFANGRTWDISLQLHMGLVGDTEAAKRVARLLHAMVPTAIVNVPFAPHTPNCLLLARDLENEGIPVNFTSTFSARQAITAALSGNVTRTNIFMGRLNEVSTHVCSVSMSRSRRNAPFCANGGS